MNRSLPMPRVTSTEAPGAEALLESQATALLPEGLIEDDEVVILLLRPSLLFVPLSCGRSLVVVAFVALFLAYLAHWPWVPWGEVQAFSFGIGVGLLRLGWQALEWYGRVYVLTDRRIIRRMGVLRIAVFETCLRSIQHTSVFRSVRERACGLGTIGFATSGSDVFEAFWVMIRDPFGVHRQVIDAMRRYGGRP